LDWRYSKEFRNIKTGDERKIHIQRQREDQVPGAVHDVEEVFKVHTEGFILVKYQMLWNCGAALKKWKKEYKTKEKELSEY
jgi:hypothetical protein